MSPRPIVLMSVCFPAISAATRTAALKNSIWRKICDAPKFITAYTAKHGAAPTIKQSHTNGNSFDPDASADQSRLIETDSDNPSPADCAGLFCARNLLAVSTRPS